MRSFFFVSLVMTMAVAANAFRPSTAVYTNVCPRWTTTPPYSRTMTATKMEALELISQTFSNAFRLPLFSSNLERKKTSELKQAFLSLCRRQNPKPNRAEIEKFIDELTPLSPVTNTANSPLLRKEWLLVWTTEKEINFFQDFNLSNLVTQTISSSNNESYNEQLLENLIQFPNGGYLKVEGSTSAVDDGNTQRTRFEFVSAKVDLGLGGEPFSIPPVGKGWFDTLYLDSDLRVDVNSRNDILICVPR